MTDPRWRRLSIWVRERERTHADYATRNRNSLALFYQASKTQASAEVFKAVRLVMEAETRRWRKEQRRKR